SSTHFFKCPEDARNEWSEITHPVPHTVDEHDANPDAYEILLVSESFVSGDKHFETGVDRCLQKHAVLQPQPLSCANCRHLMTAELRCERNWKRLVNE